MNARNKVCAVPSPAVGRKRGKGESKSERWVQGNLDWESIPAEVPTASLGSWKARAAQGLLSTEQLKLCCPGPGVLGSTTCHWWKTTGNLNPFLTFLKSLLWEKWGNIGKVLASGLSHRKSHAHCGCYIMEPSLGTGTRSRWGHYDLVIPVWKDNVTDMHADSPDKASCSYCVDNTLASVSPP